MASFRQAVPALGALVSVNAILGRWMPDAQKEPRPDEGDDEKKPSDAQLPQIPYEAVVDAFLAVAYSEISRLARGGGES